MHPLRFHFLFLSIARSFRILMNKFSSSPDQNTKLAPRTLGALFPNKSPDKSNPESIRLPDRSERQDLINRLVDDQVTSFLESPSAGVLLDITIESVFDPMCPWCFIGLRRMQAALANAEHVKAQITYVPYEFDPDTPVPPLPWQKYVYLKYPERAERIFREKLPLTLSEATTVGIRLHDYVNRPIGPTQDALMLLKACSEVNF